MSPTRTRTREPDQACAEAVELARAAVVASPGKALATEEYDAVSGLSGTLAYLVLRAGFEQLPFKLPLGHEQAVLVATAAIFVLTVLSFVFKPAGASDAFASVNWGWSFGAVVGLAAAVVAVLPLGLPFLRSRTGS